jgi:oxygen-independent coproporphyrinogen-3 oxidase
MTPAAPFGIYVHFPYCKSRCPYCAFYFVVGRAESRPAYVRSILAELERSSGNPAFQRPVQTIYFGGGTPSLLEANAVDRILERIRASFDVDPGAEISLESNPDGLDEAYLELLRARGVNRLTLGWQSLDDAHLRALGRTHRTVEAARSLAKARRAGFENVGVDLIFGLPNQTTETWCDELARAAELGPDHVSAYELTFEEGTRLTRDRQAGRFVPPDEDARAEMFEGTERVLSAAGIERYEISNFARPGHECAHNLAGWRGGDLLGVGASAASHVRNERWTNVADLDEYVRRVDARQTPEQSREVLDDELWAAEDLYLGLRTTDGLDADARLASVDEPGRSRLLAALERACEEGLAERVEARTRLTRRGRLLADTVFEELLVR